VFGGDEGECSGFCFKDVFGFEVEKVYKPVVSVLHEVEVDFWN